MFNIAIILHSLYLFCLYLVAYLHGSLVNHNICIPTSSQKECNINQKICRSNPKRKKSRPASKLLGEHCNIDLTPNWKVVIPLYCPPSYIFYTLKDKFYHPVKAILLWVCIIAKLEKTQQHTTTYDD